VVDQAAVGLVFLVRLAVQVRPVKAMLAQPVLLDQITGLVAAAAVQVQ
jgi:hypothetical protein